MIDGYVYVQCYNCGYRGLTSVFVGETVEDVTCPNCGSTDIEVDQREESYCVIGLFQYYKTLNFSHKVQVIRLLALIQVLGFQLFLHIITSSQLHFYLETWVGASWFVVIALLLVEIAYEVKTYDD